MGTSNTRLSPRQKMINLMYIVLTAMLALNVSSDVLDGFIQVHDGLKRSNVNVEQRNASIYRQLEAFAEQNPDKGAVWYEKGTQVRLTTRDIYNYIDSLKIAIVKQVDGPNGNPDNIVNREDLEAAAVVMLSPANKNGEKLRQRINKYREYIAGIVIDPDKRKSINEALRTADVARPGILTPQSWEEAQFDQKPVVAAVTLLTKLQNDILFAEGEALSTLLSQVDAGDVRVNSLDAFVIPQSRIIMRGGKYQANIVLAAVDTTQRPEIYVGGRKLGSDGIYSVSASSSGNFDYSGYLEVPHGDGTVTRHDFRSSYTVIDPMATVSATMMNVLYAGIDNPISISVPGVPMNQISATMTNGSLVRSGDHWVARPSTIGQTAKITVTANIDGHQTNVADMDFRVRKLPDPTPYIAFTDAKGNVDHYKGGKGFAKTLLMAAPGLEAAIDDGLLDTKFKVISFETVFFDSMGNAMPELSDGANFSQRQKANFQRLQRGKRFYISRIKAVGPDGVTRELSPMEVIVN